jgi:hypothetical protein
MKVESDCIWHAAVSAKGTLKSFKVWYKYILNRGFPDLMTYGTQRSRAMQDTGLGSWFSPAHDLILQWCIAFDLSLTACTASSVALSKMSSDEDNPKLLL